MKKHYMMTALLTSVAAIAFENKNGWKMDGDVIAVDGSGNPIYIDASGREMSVEHGTISRLNGEAKAHRERAEAAEASLKKYDGITDPDAARKALETVGKLDAKQLIDAGKVDEVKAEITKQYEQKVADLNASLSDKDGQISNMRKRNAFQSSEFIRERVAVPPEMFEATFGSRFKDEDGKLVAYGEDGNPIYSKKRVGEIADVDEAFEIMVENYKYKDQILKAPEASGSGGQGGGGGRGGSRTVKRSEFDAATPAQKAEFASAMQKGEIQIVE